MGSNAETGHRVALLLRGINVGGRHRVPMAELRALVEEHGYTDVRTHLQSGNLLVDAGPEPADVVAQRLSAALAGRFGFEIPVIARTGAELADVIAADPFATIATDPARYVVTFLEKPPNPDDVDTVREKDFAPEQFIVRGREVYQWYPGGQQDSLLVKALDKAGVTAAGTARNWRTVTRLAQMTGAASESSGA
jgi:uncharacterized protein (DUF1697 family)